MREAVERWRPAPRWEGYEVSDLGRIRSWRNRGGRRRVEPLILSPRLTHGHLRVGLSAGGAETMRLARLDKLILEAFRGPHPDDAGFGYEGKVIHEDGDEWNCRLDNLRWKEPVRHPTEADIKQPGERWLPVADWTGYEVSDRGRVGSHVRGRFKILEPWVGKKNGYLYVQFYRADGTKRKFLVHRLVLETFVGPCPPGKEACHDPDNDRTNCCLDNLKWGDHFENMADAIRHGSIAPARPAVQVGPFLFADPFIPLEALIPWEVWKGIRDFAGYEASNHGRIRSYWHTKAGIGDEPEMIVGSTNKDGRRYVNLRAAPYVQKGRAVSRLILEAFSPPPAPGLVGRHVDGDCTNDFLSNLRWGSQQENARDKFHHGTILRGVDHPNAKLTPEKVREIRRRRKAGESRTALAEEFGLHKGYVKLVEEGKRWGWIDEIPEITED